MVQKAVGAVALGTVLAAVPGMDRKAGRMAFRRVLVVRADLADLRLAAPVVLRLKVLAVHLRVVPVGLPLAAPKLPAAQWVPTAWPALLPGVRKVLLPNR